MRRKCRRAGTETHPMSGDEAFERWHAATSGPGSRAPRCQIRRFGRGTTQSRIPHSLGCCVGRP